ncbi:MAG: triose-phosphate isomerase [Bacilli bacterium]|jgi:triosephosphate isomerase|nr:triose-phosphate isomerase [Bacilli bacterium]MDD3389299.1 triose-phosphate isomerase [Bacilli bacterium]MDD4344354.1 triose-phosphate isomerase [Bacilli bacterium]MDD4521042.1 triose-phosphate isomerase [Bacilli bacterium]MDY0399697.1 triose-phosphate isomerase [Bacilli bacterium]
MRKKLLVGNWKMNKTMAEAKSFALAALPLVSYAESKNIDIGVCPTYLSLDIVKKTNPKLIIGAQNVDYHTHGAYTGEIAINMLQEIDIDWALVGHSERRSYYGETNASCNLKVKALLASAITPLYCVGETLAEFEGGLTKSVVERQVREGLKDLTKEDAKKIVLAYEPVWSIGTGKNASQAIAEEVCHFIRTILDDLFAEVSEEIRILYGGSVKPDNVRTYLSSPNIDGALVGGASLQVDSFRALIENIAE